MLARLLKLCAVAVFTFLVISNAHAEKKEDIKLDIPTLMKEYKIGSDDAPIKITKFASFTCGHCATFATKTMPEIKEKYVDTGIVQITYIPFPLDEYAMKASLMVQCAPRENYGDLYDTIYSKQMDWFKSGDPTKFLINLGELAGVSKEKFNTCANSTELTEALQTQMRNAYKKHQINAVPAFVINEGEDSQQVVVGYKTAEEMSKIIKGVKTIKDLKDNK